MLALGRLQQGIDQEIGNEKASSLARTGERLEAALAALSAAEQLLAAAPTPAARATRDRLIADAGEWLWYLVVQRDAIGPCDHEQLYRIYRVPPAVLRAMGPRR